MSIKDTPWSVGPRLTVLLFLFALTSPSTVSGDRILDISLPSWGQLQTRAGYFTENGQWKGGLPKKARKEAGIYGSCKEVPDNGTFCQSWTVEEDRKNTYGKGNCKCRKNTGTYCEEWTCLEEQTKRTCKRRYGSAALPLQRKCTSRTASVSRPPTVEHIACGGSAAKRADVVDRSTARTSALRRMYLKSSVISGAANLRQTGRWSPSPVNAATVATATVTTGNVKQGRCFVVPSTREAGVVWESLWVCSDRSDCSSCLVEWRLFLMTSSRGRHRRGTAERF